MSLSTTVLSLRLSDTNLSLQRQQRHAEDHKLALRSCEEAITRLKVEKIDLEKSIALLGGY